MNRLLRGAQGLVNTVWRLGRKAAPVSAYPAVPGSGGWINLIREPFTGAWQRNVQVDTRTVLTYPAVFRCISLISSDIAKMRMRLVAMDANGIWNEVEANSPFWPVLRRPNKYQNRIQFFAQWVESKLIHGNAYVLKARDGRGVVSALYILDPTRVVVLIAPNGDVYYELRSDDLTTVSEPSITVPAREIIHDRWNTIYHPLVGTSPIHAAGVPATQGLKIQEQSTKFFEGGANPGGVLTAPGHINDDTARRLKEYWDKNYGSSGPNVGKVAILGDGLKYEPMMMSATDAQLLEQLKWSAETVCSVFGVPPHKIGIGTAPTYNNIEALNGQYYGECLQIHIESIELGLDEGLELPKPLGTEFDLSDLLRMDSKTQMEVVGDGVQRGIFAPDEARFRFNLGPVPGGQWPYLQQQNFSLEALAERDANKPFAQPAAPAPAPSAEMTDDGDSPEDADAARSFYADEIHRRSQPHYVRGAP